MSRDAFHVHTTIKSVPLHGQHTISFTVTNELARQVRVNAYLDLGKDDTPLTGIGWIQIVEPATFDLSPDGSATVQVIIDVPAELPAEWMAEKTSLQLRLVVRNIDRPDDERGESVRITLHPDRPDTRPPPPPSRPVDLRPILVIAGGAIVLAGIIGLIVFFVTRDRKARPSPGTGTIEVRVTTSGPGSDSNRYTLSLDGSDARSTTAATTTMVTFEKASAGNHLVTLTGQPAVCAVRDSSTPPGGTSSGNVIAVIVTAGQTSSIGFTVTCQSSVRQRIVWTQIDGGDADIFIAALDGAGRTNLTARFASHEKNPRVSPDGTQIAFETDRDGNAEIYVMNIDGSNPHNLSNDASHDEEPAWSPDGTRIAFGSFRDGNEIWIMNADGTAPRKLTSVGSNNGHPAWSPDGRQIAFEHGSGINDIWLVPVSGGTPGQLTSSPSVIDDSPDWSSDGSRIAFSSNRDGQREIYVMRADGTNAIRLTSTTVTESQPAWSPDDSKMLFEAGGTLRVMSSDGSQATNVSFAFGGDPRWVPTP